MLQHKIVEQINQNDCTPYIGLWLWCSTPVSVISISWRSGLLMEETGEDHRSAESHWQTLKHKDVSNGPCLSGIRAHNVSGDFIDSFKSIHTSSSVNIILTGPYITYWPRKKSIIEKLLTWGFCLEQHFEYTTSIYIFICFILTHTTIIYLVTASVV